MDVESNLFTKSFDKHLKLELSKVKEYHVIINLNYL